MHRCLFNGIHEIASLVQARHNRSAHPCVPAPPHGQRGIVVLECRVGLTKVGVRLWWILMDEGGCLWPYTLNGVVLLNSKSKGGYVAHCRLEELCFPVERKRFWLASIMKA